MARPPGRLATGYGSGLLHLVVNVGGLTVAGWVALRLADEPAAGRILLWFVGAAIAHDLVLFPLYSGADAGLRRLLRASGATTAPGRVRILNHIRVPALAAGLTFLIYLPGILGLGKVTYQAATGQHRQQLLGEWLTLVAVLFAVSGVVYAVRVGRRARHGD
ncbi:hypothetical protein C1I95_10435 [Micromonospora craterilacus]|uniref:Uncharacterized protein n=1 Tax=Micromonospora craterilacus TaxID=1655439 RepID=A0A2W2E6W6_9ACTN|nr:hypothetical protein [Micromonospora craterilacus]PZG20046.1 hypothetical protein C1I95_10435 [Micromonospora craterilacus]